MGEVQLGDVVAKVQQGLPHEGAGQNLCIIVQIGVEDIAVAIWRDHVHLGIDRHMREESLLDEVSVAKEVHEHSGEQKRSFM